MAADLDCVILGYFEAPLDQTFANAAAMQQISGGFRHLKANAVVLDGRRVTYPGVLNAGIEAATGHPSSLHVGRLPNLGAHLLASFLRKHGLTAEVVNFVNADQEQLDALLARSPRAVAITTTFYFEAQPIRHLVDMVRRGSPDSTIIVGGPHIFHLCSDYQDAAQHTLFSSMGADVYVFDSQGELTLTHICQELKQPRPDLGSVPNLIYTTDGRTFHHTPRVPENNAMDETSVDWPSFAPQQLLPTVQTRTARSCAYKCAFCRYPVVAGDLNLTSLAVVERELDELKAIGVTHLLFIDDTFNIPRERFKDLCRLMIRRRYDFRWFSYFRCANADDESFELAAASGCTGVFLGIESGDSRVLRAMNKGADPNKYRYGLKRLHEAGVLTYASFIIGHPGETEETAQNTLAFIEETQPSMYCLEAYFHDPKVPIAQKAELFGLTGRAYSWQHNTMDWRRATELVEEGYRTITGSAVCPLYSFDLWSFAYLLGLGYSREQLLAFLRVTSRMLVDGLDNDNVDSERYLPELAHIFQLQPTPASA